MIAPNGSASQREFHDPPPNADRPRRRCIRPSTSHCPAIVRCKRGRGRTREKACRHHQDGGLPSLATSRLAVEMASVDIVKMFAKFEVAEQETIADILKSMKMDKAEGALKVPTKAEVEAMLHPAGKDSQRSRAPRVQTSTRLTLPHSWMGTGYCFHSGRLSQGWSEPRAFERLAAWSRNISTISKC